MARTKQVAKKSVGGKHKSYYESSSYTTECSTASDHDRPYAVKMATVPFRLPIPQKSPREFPPINSARKTTSKKVCDQV